MPYSIVIQNILLSFRPFFFVIQSEAKNLEYIAQPIRGCPRDPSLHYVPFWMTMGEKVLLWMTMGEKVLLWMTILLDVSPCPEGHPPGHSVA